MLKNYYIYLLTNKRNSVIYTGVTRHLTQRVYQHKIKLQKGFTQKYNVNKLVYFETTTDIYVAIKREKQIKGWKRIKKIALIEKDNPEWLDLFLTIL